MELKVQRRSRQADGNLYAYLPGPVCESLAERGIFFGALRISFRSQAPFYCGWSGGACGVGRIELDDSFAELLQIPHNVSVQVTLASSLESSDIAQNVAARTVELTPLYDGSQSEQQETFSAFSAAVNALEIGLLQQIRVIHKDLCFPVTLPGNRIVPVRVESTSSFKNEGEESSPFVILVPDSRILVTPPAMDRKQIELPLTAVLRALPVPPQLQMSFPTYGFVSSTFESLFRSRKSEFLCLYLSPANKSEVGRALSIPVAACVNDHVPPGHIFVPSFICNTLAVPFLTPLYVEESSESLDPPSGVRIISNSVEWALVDESSEGSKIADISELHFLSLPTILFPEANLGKIELSSAAPNNDMNWKTFTRATEVWDRPWKESIGRRTRELSGSEIGDPSSIDKEQPTILPSLPAWYFSPDLKVKSMQRHTSLLRNGVRGGNDTLEQDQDAVQLSKIPGEFSRTAIFNIVTEAQRGFGKGAKIQGSGGSSSSSLVLLEGAQGSGKTFALRRAAALLRKYAKARTVWIRCQFHKGEPERASLSRICSAVQAAADGGPGVVVFDDADLFFSSSYNGKEQMKMEDNSVALASKRKLAHCLLHNIYDYETVRRGSIVVVLACVKTETLNECLRSPSTAAKVIKMGVPETPDRAVILASLTDTDLSLGITSSSSEEEKSIVQLLSSVAATTKGFGPHDLVSLAQRARIHLQLNDASDPSRASYPKRLLEEMIHLSSTMTPLSRKGIQFDEAANSQSLSWDEIGGLHAAKTIVKETLQLPSRYPNIFANAPIRQKRGILLYGPPGCGKSILATAAASSCGMRSICIRGPELLRKYIGESEAEVRRLFERAAAIQPCVIIFDEFDALAPRRGGESTGVADRVVNTLLTALDGVEEMVNGIFVIGTSSRPETIDPALLRPGRFDLWVPVDLPETIPERLDILSAMNRSYGSSLSPTTLLTIAEQTSGFSGADLHGVITDLQLTATRLSSSSDSLTEKIREEALALTLSEAKPSISIFERQRYANIMAQFDKNRRKKADKDRAASADSASEVTPLNEVLRRVALK